jgi:hypothetical protein
MQRQLVSLIELYRSALSHVISHRYNGGPTTGAFLRTLLTAFRPNLNTVRVHGWAFDATRSRGRARCVWFCQGGGCVLQAEDGRRSGISGVRRVVIECRLSLQEWQSNPAPAAFECAVDSAIGAASALAGYKPEGQGRLAAPHGHLAGEYLLWGKRSVCGRVHAERLHQDGVQEGMR